MTQLSFIQKGGILLLSILCQISAVSAESCWVLPLPSVVEEGSAPEISLAFSYGTENDPVPATNSFSMTYAYTGYSIDEGESDIVIDLENSWFGDETEVLVSYSIDHEAREITVTLTRNDNEEIAGFGFTIRLKGIIIVVDDFDKIKNPYVDFVFDAYFSSDSETLSLTMKEDFGPLRFTLYGLNGSLIAEKQHVGGSLGKWHLANIAPQIYVLEMANQAMVFRKKIAIGR